LALTGLRLAEFGPKLSDLGQTGPVFSDILLALLPTIPSIGEAGPLCAEDRLVPSKGLGNMLFPLLLLEREVLANELLNLSSAPVILPLAGSLGNTSKVVAWLRIRSASTKSLLQFAAADTVFVAACAKVGGTDKVPLVRGEVDRSRDVLRTALVFVLPVPGDGPL
jgi:hypothetical protein